MNADLFCLLDVLYCAERFNQSEPLDEPIPRCGAALREARRLGYVTGSHVTSAFATNPLALRLTPAGELAREDWIRASMPGGIR